MSPRPAGSKTGSDYARLKSSLASSKLQSTNNAAFQTIAQLIEGAKTFQGYISDTFSTFNGSLSSLFETVTNLINDVTYLKKIAIYLVEVDTSGGPETVDLLQVVRGYTIIKDITGNASDNPITCVGAVDGETDPLISTNWGVLKVYKHDDGTFYRWENVGVTDDDFSVDDGGAGTAGCIACGVDGHPAGGLPLDNNTAGIIVCGTFQEFPALTGAEANQTDRDNNQEELLLRMIWHLNQYGFTAGRQRNPSGLISNDKLTFLVGAQYWTYDVFLGVDFSSPMVVQMNSVGPPNYVAEAGIPD